MDSFSFEWDAAKARSNMDKHHVSFEEAVSIFSDPYLMTYFDEFHSTDEERCISIGRSQRNRLLLVVHTDRGNAIRLISCRKATAAERTTYEQS